MKRVVLVEANFDGRALTEVSRRHPEGVDAKIADAGRLPRSSWAARRSSSRRRSATSCESLLLAVIFIYLVLASQFGSFLQPLAIMFSLPLSMVGVMLALLSTEHHLQHHEHDRRDPADGPGDQERDPADRLRQPGARAREGTAARR